MRHWKLFLVGALALALVGTAGPANAAPAVRDALPRPPAGARPPVAPGAFAHGKALWDRLSPAQRDRAMARLGELVGPRLRAAAPAGTSAGTAGAWRDVLAGKGVSGKGVSAHGVVPSFSRGSAGLRAADAGDPDGDGLDQGFEAAVADAFTPLYHVSAGERAGTGFAIFGDFVPQTAVQVFGPVPPISYFRVLPLGFATDVNGTPVGVLRLDYLTLWNRDDGLKLGGICGAAVGFVDDLLGVDLRLPGHDLDNERSAILVAAPVPAPGVFNADPNAYSAYSFYTAAHENTPFVDESMVFRPDQPVPAGLHINLAFSFSKHSTYPYNPDGQPIVQAWVIDLAFNIITDLYFAGVIDFDTYALFVFLAQQAFFGCIVESFSDQGGTFAGTRIDVGEPGRALNGSGFIEDRSSGIFGKLADPVPF
jgi:hypothetical protein